MKILIPFPTMYLGEAIFSSTSHKRDHRLNRLNKVADLRIHLSSRKPYTREIEIIKKMPYLEKHIVILNKKFISIHNEFIIMTLSF